MTDRIRWMPTEHGSLTGHVGTLDSWSFQIWKPESNDDEWLLESNLPGLFDKRSYSADPEELKREAERWLEQAVASIGAVLPDYKPEEG